MWTDYYIAVLWSIIGLMMIRKFTKSPNRRKSELAWFLIGMCCAMHLIALIVMIKIQFFPDGG